MKLQELFDKAVKAQLKQKAYAINLEKQACAYITKEGNRCLLGHLMSKEEAEKAESWSYDGDQAVRLLDVPDDFVRPLINLQNVHDATAGQSHWEFDDVLFIKAMKDYAKSEGLNYDQ